MKNKSAGQIASYLFIGLILSASLYADQVEWRISGGGKIKQIRYFNQPTAAQASTETTTTTAPSVLSYTVDSPPVDGFVPWVTVLTTNKREEELVLDAIQEPSITGTLTNPDYQTQYAIGIFDTGASAHVLGYQNAQMLNLFNSTYKTSNVTVVSGVTGEVDAWVSQPFGLFAQGLWVLEPNTPTDPTPVLRSTADFVGESNVSVLMGDNPGSMLDLITAIGIPLSVYYTTSIKPGNSVTITRNGTTYTAPEVRIYSQDDPGIPSYPNKLPLELRPLGAAYVQYISYDLEGIMGMLVDPFGGGTMSFNPTTPSVIIGTGTQSLFFVHSVDLAEGTSSAIDKTRFMLDTGAQISVISSRIAARLKLNPANRDFEVEIEGVTGESIMAPGFYLDSLTMPAIGEWLEYTNVPVVLLDISSPEGGKLDGIIGMNLFTQYNIVIRGGGLFLQDDPVLEFERITAPLAGDIAPAPDGDGIVDMQDLGAYSSVWMTTSQSANWNGDADIAPAGQPDNTVDIQDLNQLADNWLTGSL
ncbi:MAG: retroviral-like aspartic protease family protein [Sedimentisphaerales bacterium]|nr:retroviral-like aspartic protease family protein [Sedimentisphaerales bacterium]